MVNDRNSVRRGIGAVDNHVLVDRVGVGGDRPYVVSHCGDCRPCFREFAAEPVEFVAVLALYVRCF